MHIPDAVLNPAVALATGAVGAAGLLAGLRTLEKRLGGRTTVLMGTMSAFVFAAQMVSQVGSWMQSVAQSWHTATARVMRREVTTKLAGRHKCTRFPCIRGGSIASARRPPSRDGADRFPPPERA